MKSRSDGHTLRHVIRGDKRDKADCAWLPRWRWLFPEHGGQDVLLGRGGGRDSPLFQYSSSSLRLGHSELPPAQRNSPCPLPWPHSPVAPPSSDFTFVSIVCFSLGCLCKKPTLPVSCVSAISSHYHSTVWH